MILLHKWIYSKPFASHIMVYMNKTDKKEIIGMFEVLGAFTLAGSSIVAGKLLSFRVPIFLTGFLSLLFALIILFPFQLKKLNELKKINKREFILMLFQAVCGIVMTRVLTLYGLRFTTALNAGLINSSTPAVMALFSVLIFKEQLRRYNYAGLLFALAGMMIITFATSDGNRGTVSMAGNILIFGAVLAEVLMTIFRKMTRQNISSLTNTTVLFFISLLIFLPFAIGDLQSYSISLIEKRDWISILFYGIFGSAIAYLLWGDGVMKISATRAGVGTTMIPLTTIVLSALILGEQFTNIHGLGTLFCITGMILCNIVNKEKVLLLE